MITPEIKEYSCTEIDNLDCWSPEDPDDFSFWLTVSIGLPGSQAADNFEVNVVSQLHLRKQTNKKHLLVLPYYESMSQVIAELNNIISKCSGDGWGSIQQQLAKHFGWEYDG